MAIANNWEVLIARGIITAKKTEIVEPSVWVDQERFTWRESLLWNRSKVKAEDKKQ